MDIDNILQQARDEVANSADEQARDEVRVRYLGKKGELTALLKSLGQLDAAERPAAGAKINAAKEDLQELISERKRVLEREQLSAR